MHSMKICLLYWIESFHHYYYRTVSYSAFTHFDRVYLL